ncbi:MULTISPECIES: I66 family serine proteinase inhibitor [Protofrankia]|uniref:Uncharacterized protein n=1 Tax=Protofrankia coriariae TaxID=1562887 RepID=A0ABR5F0B2_9ACTN|nr:MULTISPECIES: I66 family serine proteinase inhibitor [Protofrankia]KLL10115.1 hypothetical protein FrCorBMG51_20050 [Protofrankia coriariae]ONH35225.1 hypothetical protein BL254_12385 [Protofrankia sp. BMG5.30]
MGDEGKIARIIVRGAPTGVQKDLVWALLIGQEEASEWVVAAVDGGFQFTELASGKVLAAPSTDPGAQVAVAVAGAERARWTIRKFDEDDAAAKIEKVDQIVSGFYTLELAGTGRYLGRSIVEDRSLLPKRVVLLPAGEGEEEPLVIEVR